MFTTSAPAPTSPGLVLGSTHQLSTSPSLSSGSPSRPSRLRGLSYLRNYTQTHILSREHSAGSTTSQNQLHGTPGSVTTPTSTGTSANNTPSEQPAASSASISGTRRPTSYLTRSVTESAAASLRGNSPSVNPSTTPARANNNRNRLTLINTEAAHPLSVSPPPSARPSVGRRVTDSAFTPVLVPLIADSTVESNNSTSTTHSTPTAGVSAQTTVTMTRTRAATVSEVAPNLEILPSIRFSTFYDPRAPRPSLSFTPITRTLPTGSEVIRVGRYSERDTQPNIQPNTPSAAPVGFKSKVVSRRHCEFWYEAGKWYIKDVKSSSGTFLNHIRLSPPGTESKPFPINDGDIVQLGIDFKGGEEMIFRCVKMRLELNRGWQSKLNTFNMNTHKKLRTLISGSADKGGSAASQSSAQDCSICLNNIAPCQCLFVAPCSHTWHYKCIRSLLSSPSYPIFICPNCRAAADLEAEVEDPEEWEHVDSDEGPEEQQEEDAAAADLQQQVNSQAMPPPRRSREETPAIPSNTTMQQSPDVIDLTMTDAPSLANDATASFANAISSNNVNLTLSPMGALPRSSSNRSVSMNATSTPIGIPTSSNPSNRSISTSIPRRPEESARTPSPPTAHPAFANGNEGPITPRNDVGPWVFDGSGVRIRLGGGDSTAAMAQAASTDEMAL